MSDVQGQGMKKASMEFQNSRKENSKSFQGWGKWGGRKEEKRERERERESTDRDLKNAAANHTSKMESGQ